MKFKVSPHDIQTKELIAAEGSIAKTVLIMQRFMVDESGNKIPEEEAAEIIGELPLDEITQAQTDFVNAILPNLKSGK